MNSKTIKTIFLFLIVLFSIIFFNNKSKSCSGDYTTDDYYTIFGHDYVKMPLYQPFFLSDYRFYPEDDSTSLDPNFDNLNAWKSYYKGVPSIKDIDMFIFKSNLKDLENIISFLNKDVDTINSKWWMNSMFNYIKKNKDTNTVKYLIYAKKCEPFVTHFDCWTDCKIDTAGMSVLINLGLKHYNICKNVFLKQRYAYQIIRLAFYSYQYEETINYYNKFFANDTSENLIRYWSLADKAGALRRLGHIVESNYLFSKVFDKCPSRRLASSDSYKFVNDSSFQASLNLCKNNKEKAAFWMLSAFKNQLLTLNAMREIYKLEPTSPYLILLLSREIDGMERELLPSMYDSYYGYRVYVLNKSQIDYDYSDDTQPSINDFESLKFIDSLAKIKSIPKKYLWELAAGYLSTLLNKTNDAEPFYYYAENDWPKGDTSIKVKIKIFRIINEVTDLKKMESYNENKILDDLKWLYNYHKLYADTAFIFVRNILAKKYAQNLDIVKMHLCIGSEDFNYNLYDISNEPLDCLIDFFEKPHKTDYEKFLMSIYKLSKYDLYDLKGTLLLRRHNFKEAVRYFKKALNTETLNVDPFVIHINDCISCDYKAQKNINYTKLTFAERMLHLDSLAVNDKDKAEKYYFLLANGYYNISSYGNCSGAVSYDQSYYNHDYTEDETHELTDCSDAKKNYEKVISITKDREFAAESAFMAAKCEQNDYYSHYISNAANDSIKVKKYRTFFKLLKAKYSDTDFYKEALNECKYFNEFVKKY